MNEPCNRIFLMKSHPTGGGFCIGFTKEAPEGVTKGDVIHLCWLNKENIEKMNKEKGSCYGKNKASCTPNEALRIALEIIRATAFRDVAVVKKDE